MSFSAAMTLSHKTFASTSNPIPPSPSAQSKPKAPEHTSSSNSTNSSPNSKTWNSTTAKKTFPEFEDSGKVTFRIIGNGAKLTFTYTLRQDPEDTVPRIREGFASFDISDMDIEFDKTTLNHPHMVPMLSKVWKMQIRMEIEKEVEISLNAFMEKLGDRLMESLKGLNRPFLGGIETAKKAVKSAQLTQGYEKRREKLENCK